MSFFLQAIWRFHPLFALFNFCRFTPFSTFCGTFYLNQRAKMGPSSNGAPAGATSMIIPSLAYINQLQSLVPSAQAQTAAGYVTEELTDRQLEQKKRCLRCGVRRKPIAFFRFSVFPCGAPGSNLIACIPYTAFQKASRNRKSQQPATALQPDSSGSCNLTSMDEAPSTVAREKQPHLRCKFHPGKVVSKVRFYS